MISIDVIAGDRVRITVHPRVWRSDTTSFSADHFADGEASQDFDLELEPVTAEKGAPQQDESSPTVAELVQPSDGERSDRALANRLSKLPHLSQLLLGSRLGLVSQDDRTLRSFALTTRLIEQARALNRLSDLWRAAVSQAESGAEEHDPYSQEAN